MKIILLISIFTIFSDFATMGSALACESYEECIDTENKIEKYYLSPTKEEMEADSASFRRGYEYYNYHRNASHSAMLKAISFKLAEISEKLDSPSTKKTYGVNDSYWIDYCSKSKNESECLKYHT